MIYCIDSHIIIWGIKKQATPGQEEMIERAEQVFIPADEMEDVILIPTIVLAEVLAPEPQTIRIKYLEALSKSFIIAPFDERAAMKYAEILYGRIEEVKEAAAANDISRRKMKADHMIIATALAYNANCIYTTDKGLKAFANGLIDVRDAPPLKPNASAPHQQTKITFPESDATQSDERD